MTFGMIPARLEMIFGAADWSLRDGYEIMDGERKERVLTS
jgi:hypothetical protein